MYDILFKRFGQQFPNTFLKFANFEDAQNRLREIAIDDLCSRNTITYMFSQDDADDFISDNIDPNLPDYKYEGPGFYSNLSGRSVYLDEDINSDDFKLFTYAHYVYYISDEY